MPKRNREPGEHEEPGFARLPAGRHGLPRGYVVENQRTRLLVGIVRAVARRGYNATTITEIAEAASVSRQTFYDNFQNKQECFLAAYDRAVDDVQTAMAGAGQSPSEWADKVAAALGALLDRFAPEPDLARFVWLEPVGAGEVIVARHREAMRALIELLIADRPPNPGIPPSLRPARRPSSAGSPHSSPSGSAPARPSA